jgi:hypothetical protein
MVKCLLLKNDIILISLIEEVYAEIGEPNCKLIKPFKITKNSESGVFDLDDWLDVTDQREIMMRSEDIVTLVDPKSEILAKYLELTA